MYTTTSELDEAFDRIGSAAFEYANGFINHGAMAVEALSTLGRDEVLDAWARRATRIGGEGVTPVDVPGFDLADGLGERQRLPELIGWFERAIDIDGWAATVARTVPVLLPALRAGLFHGAIRAGHAVRAISFADTGPRRAELARALGYWACRFTLGATASDVEVDSIRVSVLNAAADATRHYLARPGILELHGVTGAMAVDLLVPHLDTAGARLGLAQLRAEHVELYRGIDPVAGAEPLGVAPVDLVDAATVSRDPHQVKLVEACLRADLATGDPVFQAAAEVVTTH